VAIATQQPEQQKKCGHEAI
jgi:hypothetical protein